MPSASPSHPAPAPGTVSELDRETMAFWVEVSDTLGFPRSLGEIYGLLFVSTTPLNADDVVARVGISRSGAGQALKTLAEIGAVRPAAGLSSRKDHYELQTDLGVLVRLFLNSRVFPRLEELSRRRAALGESARKSGPAHLAARFDKLDRWRGKTKPLLALLKSLASE
jgi:DNA-binding transcriptional regulator GbsR (MarR family)